MANYGRVDKRAENASVSVAAGTTAEIISIPIPPHCRLRLKDFGNYIDIVAAWSLVSWSFLHNGRPIPQPFDLIRDQIGYAAQRQPVQELELSSGVLAINGTNGAAVAVAMGISLGYELIYQE